MTTDLGCTCIYRVTWHNRLTGERRTYTCGLPIAPEDLAPYRHGQGVCHRHERGLSSLLGMPQADGWPTNPHGMALHSESPAPRCPFCGSDPARTECLAGNCTPPRSI